MIEIAASALADKLAIWERDLAVKYRTPAREIVSMFTADHIKLHAWDGADKWWNLDMRRRGAELKAKDIADTKRAAKAKRIDDKWRAFTRAMAKGRKPKHRRSTWRRK